jgi:hypothetical protein
VIIAMVVCTILAFFVPPRGLLFAWAVLIGVSILLWLLVLGSLLSLRAAWPVRRGTRRSRVGFAVVAVPVALVVPVDFALLWVPIEYDRTPRWFDITFPLMVALVVRIAAGVARGRGKPDDAAELAEETPAAT